MNYRCNKPTVIFLMGPTASGKTDLAIALSQRLPIDVISVDSALIYKGMDIGTAKPSQEKLRKTPHALIDICDPSEIYSVANFCRDVQQAIDKSHSSHRVPLLVGGTMMYFYVLLHGLIEIPATDEMTRMKIENEARVKGWPTLHAELMLIDPDSALQIHPNHSQRITRALAVYRISGKSITLIREQQAYKKKVNVNISTILTEFEYRYTLKQFALIPENRLWLHKRIKKRYYSMLEQGFIDEVRDLYLRDDLNLDLPSIRTVGYQQVWKWLADEYDHAVMVDKGLIATRQLAKRQMTWLKKWKNLNVLNVGLKNESLEANLKRNVKKALNFLSFESI